MTGCFINIENGRLKDSSKEPMRRVLAACPTGRYWFEPKRKDRRTLNQNNYMHLMFSLIQKGFYDNGYREVKTADDAKYIMKDRFLKYWIDNGTGGKMEMVRRTRDLTKEQMATFIDECIQFSAENLSVVIPPPNTQTQLIFTDGNI